MHKVATFWHGKILSGLDAACLASFAARGFDVTVFAYERNFILPPGVQFESAEEILPREYMSKFYVLGRPSVAHFSDFFRYSMFEKTALTWIDSDVFCLDSFETSPDLTILGLENVGLIGNAVMRIAQSDPRLVLLLKEVEKMADHTSRCYGATGPKIITDLFSQPQIALPPYFFYPIPSHEWWKVFLPEYRPECEQTCKGSQALHLWNNVISSSGYWKDLLPPSGSFLHSLIVESGSSEYFQSTIPVSVMAEIANNYRMLKSGDHFRLSELLRMVIRRGSRRPKFWKRQGTGS